MRRFSGARRLLLLSPAPPPGMVQSAGISFDARNGRSRLTESPYEWEYAERLLRGTGQARFEAPVFGALDG